MACVLYDSLGDSMRGGPFPHKAGEYCVNVLRRYVMIHADGSVVIMHPGLLSALPASFDKSTIKFRLGKPAALENLSSQEFEKYGYVGLYLAEDRPLGEDEIETDTDILTEDVVSGKCFPQKPFDATKIRRREL